MATTEQIDNYPGFEDGIDGYTLATKMKKGADRFGVETAFAQVEEMELTSNPKKLITSEGEVLGRTVILAMGALPANWMSPESRRCADMASLTVRLAMG